MAGSDTKGPNTFDDVFRAEWKYLRERRDRQNGGQGPRNADREGEDASLASTSAAESESSPKKPRPPLPPLPEYQDQDVKRSVSHGLVGLALSGGGIRSATFNLGVLQALARLDLLRCVDYLSTVSGGGYIGSCFSSLLTSPNTSVNGDASFPFWFDRSQGDKDPDERIEVKHLREHGNYVAQSLSLFRSDVWRMVANYTTGLVLSNLLPLSLLLALGIVLRKYAYLQHTTAIRLGGRFLLGGLAVFLFVLALRFAFARLDRGYRFRRWAGIWLAVPMMIAAALAVVGVLIIGAASLHGMNKYLKETLRWIVQGGIGVSLLGLLFSLFDKGKMKQTLLKFLVDFGWIILLPLLLLKALHWMMTSPSFDAPPLPSIALALFILSFFTNLNRVSLHHFYRDRLSEAYIIKKRGVAGGVESNEEQTLQKLHQRKNGPYHLINATLNVPGSSKSTYEDIASRDPDRRNLRGRKADLFLFSKEYCGSESTNYRRTEVYEGGETRLATVMAVAGAAASPQMGASTNAFLRILMSLLNVRLHRWMPHPRLAKRPKFVWWPYIWIKEMLGWNGENDRMINLSDGGHYENLGVYSLIKRRCKFIIASDGTADADFDMNDLANVIRKVRIDFGVDITMNMAGLRRDQPRNPSENDDRRFTPLHYAVGVIDYPGDEKGVLIYLNTTLTETDPQDLLTYRRKNPSFPDQSTADQFFDEAQFESYRKLGDLTVREAFARALGLVNQASETYLDDVFQHVKQQYEPHLGDVSNGAGAN